MYGKLPTIAILCTCISWVNGHGYLLNPLSRNSLSLRFKDVTPNFNRMGLNCGGANHQWDICNGVCGVCGDPCDAVKKAHEPGGKYYVNRKVEEYQPGQHINVSVRITSHHKGYFTFYLAKAAADGGVTQAELNAHHLKVKDGNTYSDRYNLPNEGNKIYRMQVKLPNGFTCAHCVLQWYYTTGNNWCGKKCTPRDRKAESFVNCADIEIIGGQGSNQGNTNQGNSNQGSNSQGNSNQGSNNQGNNQGSSNQGSNNQGNNQGSNNQGSNNQGNNQGSNNQGSNNQGNNQGSNNQGNSNQGSNNQGNSNQGSNNQGSSNQGSNNQGNSNQGSNNQGNSNQGSNNQSGNNNQGNNNNAAGNNQVSGNSGNGQNQNTNNVVVEPGLQKCSPPYRMWCKDNCNHVPPYCPQEYCNCDYTS